MTNFITSLIAGLVFGAALATAGIGFTLQFGVTNYFNIGYGELLTIGAMVAVTLNAGVLHWNIWLAALVGIAVTGIAGVLINRLVYSPFLDRRRDIFTILLVTFGVAILLDNIYLLVWGSGYRQFSYTPGAVAAIGGVKISEAQIVYLLIAALCLISVQLMLKRTKIGRSMRAMSDNSSLAMISGLNIRRTTDITWLATGLLAGASGLLFALETHTFNTTLGLSYEYYIFVAVILGGIGKPLGAVLGGILIGVATQLAALFVPSGLSPVIAFAVLIVVMLLRPQGLLGVPGRLGRVNV